MMPTPIQLEKFTNREDELKIVCPKLDEIQKPRPYLFDFILRFVGIPGIGKTTLLKQIEKEAKDKNIRTASIQCKNIENSNLVGEICTQLFGLTKNADVFINDLQSFLTETPVVLLIDDTHHLNEQNQEMLENVLGKVHHKNRLLVILAGRSDLRWERFELRRRTGKVFLEQFRENQARNWIKDDDFSDRIYRITRGYPLAIVKACDWLSSQPDSEDPNQLLRDREIDLVFALVDQILNQYILGDIHYEKHNELIFLLKNLSPLRRFDENILSEFLPKLDHTRFSDLDTLNARMLIRQMSVATYLVKWNSARMAYALDYLIRRLLALEMKFRDEPTLLTIHESLMDWYDKSIKKALERDPSAPQTVLYIIEYIYHFSHSRQIKGQTQGIQDEITQKIKELFKGYKSTEKDHLYQELKKDDELDEILGDDFKQLIGFVNENR